MLSCREVTRLTASDELGRAGWWVRVRVRLHRLMCRHCSEYARQLRLLGDLVRESAAKPVDRAFTERIDRTIRTGQSGE
ncbi:MAG: hypothetical protein ABI542_04690 [Gemmatimonadota bacterium]